MCTRTLNGTSSKSGSICPPKDREFVPQDDDFEFLKLLGPSAQSHEFEQPAKRHVAQRHEHEASYVARLRPNSTHQPYSTRFCRSGSGAGSEFVHPCASRQGRHVQWELVSPEEKSGPFVAWVASVEETKRMKPTDEAILGMVSESPGRNGM
jgi:hypothetical protein